MRRFAKNIGLMILALAAWAAGMNSLQVRRMKASIPDDKTTLVIGDSHSTGFHGDQILNLSKNGAPLPIQVGKALIAIEKGSFKTVICVIGPQTASSEPRRLMNNERNWLSGNQSRACLVALAKPQILKLMTPKSSLHLFLNLFNWNKKAPLTNRYEGHGSETNLSSDVTNRRLLQLDVARQGWYCDSARLKKTLASIAKECQDRAIHLHLIETPYHHTYRSQIQPDDYAKFKSDISAFSSSRDHVSYSDFSDSDYPDDHFSDADHLNQRGFERFMHEELQSLLN